MAKNEVEVVIKAKDEASKVFQGLGSSLKTALGIGLGIAAVGFGAVAAGLGLAVKEAMEAQEVAAQLDAVLRSTGGAAGVTAEMANGLAESLMKVTRFSDETIVSTETMLLGFRNIGKDIFPQVTEMALDLSTRLGVDTATAARTLGKALDQPAEGLTVLTRMGVRFTDEQKAMIDMMVEAGDTAGAQKFILDALQDSYGGAARAAGDTLAGKMDILRNSLLNIAEKVGMAVIPILQRFLDEVIIPLIPQIEALAARFTTWITGLASSPLIGWFQQLITTIQTFITTVVIPFVTLHAEEFKGALIAIGAVLAAAGIIAGILAVAGAIGALFSPIGLIIGAVALLGAAWAGNWGGIREKTAAVIDFLKPYILGFIQGIQQWWAENGETIIATVQAIWDRIVQGFQFAIAFFKQIFAAFRSAFEGDWRGFGENLRKAWDMLWTKVKQIVTTAITNILNAFRNVNWSAVGAAIIDGIKSGVVSAAKRLAAAAIAAAKAALDAVKGFLGIQSPSKVFVEIGGQMMAGMAKGIQLNSLAPSGAMVGATAQTIPAQKTNGGGAGSVSIGNIEINIFTDEPATAGRSVVNALEEYRAAANAGLGYAG